MKLRLKIAAVAPGVIAFLALASYFTTSRYRDGGFPPGEFRIYIRDPERKPVQGAILRVYRDGTPDLAYKYPLHNHLAGQDLVSDEDGLVTAIRKPSRFEFGGHAWYLFWVIPMGATAPEYDCEITADGFRPLKFPVAELFETTYRYDQIYPKTQVKVDGKEFEVPLYRFTFTLKR